MGMKYWLNACLLLLLLLLTACSTTSPTANAGTGYLYLANQGGTTLSAFVIALENGTISYNGNVVQTGVAPVALAFAPGAAFVANENPSADCSAAGSISIYPVNTDLTLNDSTGSKNVGSNPKALAVDPSQKFLFVANEGCSTDPTSGTVSVFSVNGTTLTEVKGSPFATEVPGATAGSGPASLTVLGNYLYVVNNFANNVSAFSFDPSSGVLTQLPQSPYAAGLSPSGIGPSRDGNFVFVANTGSNTVTIFAACVQASGTCVTPNGTLTQSGTPVSAGQGPVAISADPSFDFVYVLNYLSSQISQYRYSPATGALTPLSPASISTGLNPMAFVVRSGTTGSDEGNVTLNPTDYVYVANYGAATMSVYTLNTSTGLLTVSGQPITTGGQPSALATF